MEKEERVDEGEMQEENSEEKVEVKSSKISNKNPWMISTLALGVIIILGIFFVFKGGGITGDVISEGDAGDKLVDYLNGRAGGGVSLISTESEGDLYRVTVSYKGDEIPVYITKDGKYFVQGVAPIDSQASAPTQQAQQQPPAEIEKSDNPKVELFVMTHCPYGTQAEKGLIPVLELFGDKIDGSIKFVHYFMHDPEKEETPIQVCIREEQEDKYLDYLKCFLEDDDSERCLKEVKISQGKLNTCLESKAEGYYAADSKESQGYGVSGSPTLVINGQIVQSGRSSAAFLATICSAFNTPPEECSEGLSSENPSPGFGYSASSGNANSATQCG